MEIDAKSHISDTLKDKVKLRALHLAEHIGMDVMQRDDHPQSTKLFVDLARAFQIDVTEDDRHYWQAVLNMSRALDTLIDDDKVQSIAPYLQRLRRGVPLGVRNGTYRKCGTPDGC